MFYYHFDLPRVFCDEIGDVRPDPHVVILIK